MAKLISDKKVFICNECHSLFDFESYEFREEFYQMKVGCECPKCNTFYLFDILKKPSNITYFLEMTLWERRMYWVFSVLTGADCTLQYHDIKNAIELYKKYGYKEEFVIPDEVKNYYYEPVTLRGHFQLY